MEEMSLLAMTDCLITIYDSRLKALIGYQSTDFTREIIMYMFRRFKKLNDQTVHGGYKHTQFTYFSDILSFTPGSGSNTGGDAGASAKDLTMGLENYILTNTNMLCPDWAAHYKAKEWRKVLGSEFEKELKRHPNRYPAPLHKTKFFMQLNQTTVYRNQLAHKQIFGNSGMYKRYYILKSYDVILSYLLYSFYIMCLEPDYKLEHILD